MDFYEAKTRYLTDLARLGRSEHTIRSSDQALRLFSPAYNTDDVYSMDLTDLELVMFYRELSPASYNRYRSALISFFDYCIGHDYCDTNPAKRLPTRKVIEQPHLILRPSQMLSLLHGSNPVERIALALGMNTALRAGDIVSLKVEDVDLEKLTIRVWISKTGSYDEKPITAQLAEELERYLRDYSASTGIIVPAMLPRDWFLVPSYTITTTGDLMIRPEQQLTHPHRIVQRALERRLPFLATKGEGFHTLRRSAARALFEKLRAESSYDHALMVVKEFLNHRSTDQTQRYLGVNHERAIRDELLRGRDFLLPGTTTPGTA